MRIRLFIVFALVLGCNHERTTKEIFSNGKASGEVSKRLKEASGLAASAANPGLLWTLNDSGNSAEVFLIDEEANVRLVCKLANAINRDWEDIAVGPGPRPETNYVYVADIGDNDEKFGLKFIYRFEEPVLGLETEITITRYDTLVLRLPDAMRDTEALLLDPVTRDLFLVSKRENKAGVYRAASPGSHDTVTLDRILNLPMTQIVAGSISADGREILLKSYDHVYYWKKSGDESVAALLGKDPIELPYDREPMGEAIAWSRDGSAYYTLGESKGHRASLMKYKRNQ